MDIDPTETYNKEASMFAHILKIADLSRSVRHRTWWRVALLALLTAPLACDLSPTSPDPGLRPGPAASLLPLAATEPDFDNGMYYPINIPLAAQQQYGPSARAILLSYHLYGWRAVVGNDTLPISMQRAVYDQYHQYWYDPRFQYGNPSSSWILGAVGVGPYDWRAIYWPAFWSDPGVAGVGVHSFEVLGVMPIATDYFWDVNSVGWGLANLKSNLIAIRNWYKLRVGKTFRLAEPLVVFTEQFHLTAAQWNALDATSLPDLAWNSYASTYPSPPSGDLNGKYAGLRVVIVPLTGDSPNKFNGAGIMNYPSSTPPFFPVFAVAPSVATSVSCPATFTDPVAYSCMQSMYSIGHQLGRTFGLAECTGNDLPPFPRLGGKYVPCAGSIMGNYMPWRALLTADEIATLTTAPNQGFLWR